MEMQRAAQQLVLPRRKSQTLSHASAILIFTNLAVFAIAAWALASFGSIGGAISYYLKGETLFLDSTEKSLGIVSPGDQVGVTFKLTNRGRKQIRILGCQASCSCMIPDDLPFVLSPDESRDFTLSIRTPKPRGASDKKSIGMNLELTLFSNNPMQSRITLTIKGEIRDRSIH